MIATTREEMMQKDAMHEVKNAAGEAKEDLRYAANKAGRRVRDALESTTDSFTQAGGAVADEIRQRPIQSSLVALGCGFLLGMLARR